jgi:DNA-directed RNA polymerase specialized sigma54-like protein
MEFSNKLNLTQGLKQELGLKLTPEMRLRLDVLQATHLELRDILNKELSENPVLEDFIEDDDEPVQRSETAEKADKT